MANAVKMIGHSKQGTKGTIGTKETEGKSDSIFFCLRERDEERDEKIEQARAMREEGKTLQQIADELGYKNRSSVSRILNE